MTIGARKHRFHGPGAADVNRRALKAGSAFDSFLAYLGWLIANVLAGIWKRFQMPGCSLPQRPGRSAPPTLLAIADEVIERCLRARRCSP